MMIHPEPEELEMAISIAVTLAPNYAIRNLVKPSRTIDTRLAVDTITERVLKALNRYEITREALPHEEALGTLPLFPDDTFHMRVNR